MVGVWATRRMTTTDFSTWWVAFAGKIVHDAGCPVGLAEVKVSAHSLKATTLSWAAKAGLGHGTRRLLGHHAAPKDRSMLTYSRDALAAPLRELDRVYELIRSGSFRPDMSRSGIMAETLDCSPPLSAPLPVLGSFSCSSSSGGDSSSEEGGGVPGGAVPEAGLVLNCASRVLHIDGDDGHVRCGSRVPKAAEFTVSWPVCAYVPCGKCFRS